MTPKEKAIELYNKFRNESPVLEANYKSKRRALMCVDEVINSIKELGEELFDKQGTDSYTARCLNYNKKAFYKEVKSEMQKL